MTTTEEIRHRIQQVDDARSAKRSAAAQQVSELAQRRNALAGQLSDIERQLGEVLAETSDVMDVDELARFTDISAADLRRWLTARTVIRTRGKKSAGGKSVSMADTDRAPRSVKAPMTPASRGNAPDTPGSVATSPS